MNWEFGNTTYLFILILIPILGIIISRYKKWRRRSRNQFASEKFHDQLFDKERKRSLIIPSLYLIAVSLLIISIADIISGAEEIETQQKVSNVIFLLDVSNSMNAEDLEPNRLSEAKNIIINTMQHLQNDRVGVVIFAGSAMSIMPLTTDYTATETYLGGIETSAMKVQGTDFLKGMETITKKFESISKGSRKVVLISDGEDNEGNEEAAIRLAKKEGIEIISVGVGTEEGGPIPEYVYGQLMGYKTDQNGETVITKRQTSALKNMASSTGGSYVDGNNLENATKSILNSINAGSSGTLQKIKSYNGKHYYQYPLAASIFIFLLIFLLNPKKDFNL